MREINGCEGNVLMAVGGGQPADSYREAGVDVDAGNALVESIRPLVRATCRPGADGEIGGFGGLFDLKAVGYRDPLLVAANDGVGTKLKIAIETDNHAGVGIDLVAMCVNDLIVQGAEPLFFLDYLASSRLRFDRDRQIIQSIATGCQMAGCALIGGETAEMPGMYMDDDYDLAGFAVGAVERDLLLPRADIAIGDQLLAVPSSGVHSNGFSLIRKIISDHGLCWDSSPGFDPEKTIADIVMTPTRIYVASLLPLLRESVGIKALAHITGGGLIDNIPRILPVGLGVELDLAMLKVPGIFYWLAEMGKIPEKDMLRTFNCGVGMVLVCGRDQASTIIDKLHDAGEAAYPCGQVVEATAASGKIRVNGRLPV